jgi:hypothetical protein
MKFPPECRISDPTPTPLPPPGWRSMLLRAALALAAGVALVFVLEGWSRVRALAQGSLRA